MYWTRVCMLWRSIKKWNLYIIFLHSEQQLETAHIIYLGFVGQGPKSLIWKVAIAVLARVGFCSTASSGNGSDSQLTPAAGRLSLKVSDWEFQFTVRRNDPQLLSMRISEMATYFHTTSRVSRASLLERQSFAR